MQLSSGTYFLLRTLVLVAVALSLLLTAVWLASGRMVDTRFIWAMSLPLSYIIGCMLTGGMTLRPAAPPTRNGR